MKKLRPAVRLVHRDSFAAATLTFAQIPAQPQPVHFIVQAPQNLSGPISGRLLIFLKAGSGDKAVDSDQLSPASTWIGAREVQSLSAGASLEVDPDANGIASPAPFASIPAGDYEVQAVLDVGHTYNYNGRSSEDWISPVVALPHWTPGKGSEPCSNSTGHPEENAQRAAMMAKAKAEVVSGAIELEEFQSPLLTAFWGHPVSIKGWVVLPPGYSEQSKERYPTVYWTHGFGGTLELFCHWNRSARPHERQQDAADDLGDA